MALKIVEFFGFEPGDPRAQPFMESRSCAFIGGRCLKPDHGACSARQASGLPVIFCPHRLYAENYRALVDVAREVFGPDTNVIRPADAVSLQQSGTLTGTEAVLFGRGWGRELPLPTPPGARGNSGKYYVDWVLAKLNPDGTLQSFTAAEVQTIDSTGNYGEQVAEYFQGRAFSSNSNAGFNWENVNKRILPQLIYKGHVLRREPKCTKGLFFICPHSVLERIMNRLGNQLHSYPIGNGTITFRSYKLGEIDSTTGVRPLIFDAQFTTTVDQVATAFTSPMNLPPQGVYESAIEAALR